MNGDTAHQLESLLVEALALVRGPDTSAPVPAAPEVASVLVAEPPAAANDASYAFGDYGLFYNWLRGNNMLGPKISESEYGGCDAIILACARGGFPVSFTAYCLATAFLETGSTMQPIKEYGGNTYYTRMYDINGARPAKARELGNLSPGDGARYCGRGYVQLTGKTNYARATAELAKIGLHVDLVNNPDLAMGPDVAAAIMVLGMKNGWFTTRKLSDDLQAQGPSSFEQFRLSRDIINGRDKDDEIAGFAVNFQTALQHGGYKIAA